MAANDLRNADLSALQVKEMTLEQRQEMRRRYDDFVERMAKRKLSSVKLPESETRSAAGPRPRRWIPTKRAGR